MNPASYGAVGSAGAFLTQLIMWFSHWPLQPPTEEQASSAAGLLILLFASVHGIINTARGTSSTNVPTKDPEPMELVPAPDVALKTAQAAPATQAAAAKPAPAPTAATITPQPPHQNPVI